MLAQIATGLQKAFDTLNSIARENGHQVLTVTIDVYNTNLQKGVVNGSFTVKNRSRRKFNLTVTGDEVVVKALGTSRKVA